MKTKTVELLKKMDRSNPMKREINENNIHS